MSEIRLNTKINYAKLGIQIYFWYGITTLEIF